MKQLFLYTFLLLSLLNCETQKTSQTNQKTQESEVDIMQKTTIKATESKQIPNTDLNVDFIGIAEDSRCPKGVTCVWEGIAVAELQVMTPSSRPRTIMLATSNLLNRELSKSAEVYGYKITLLKLNPYPKENGNKEDEETSVVISVEKTK